MEATNFVTVAVNLESLIKNSTDFKAAVEHVQNLNALAIKHGHTITQNKKGRTFNDCNFINSVQVFQVSKWDCPECARVL